MSWSPFWVLRRLIGHSLFNQVGPDTSHLRNVFIREFNNAQSNKEKYDMVARVAKEHANAICGNAGSVNVDDIRLLADNFAIGLWGETLYGSPEHHADGQVLRLSRRIITLAGDPWPSVWYSLQLFLKLATPGEPTRTESKVRAEVAVLAKRNFAKLEEYEHRNPESPMKTIRSLSVATGGGRSGPLSKFASEFSNLNVFGIVTPSPTI